MQKLNGMGAKLSIKGKHDKVFGKGRNIFDMRWKYFEKNAKGNICGTGVFVLGEIV